MPEGPVLLDILGPGLLLTAFSLALVLLGDATGRQWLNGAFKPLASAGFLLALALHPNLDSTYGVAIAAGLGLGALGDVLLIARGAGRALKLGVLSFLLAHLAYIVAFALRGLDAIAAGLALLALAVLAAGVWRSMSAHITPALRGPVLAYIGVISVMLAAAIGLCVAAPAGSGVLVLTAAAIFYVSDLLVARQRFIIKRSWHRQVGLPLYYGAQFLFVATL